MENAECQQWDRAKLDVEAGLKIRDIEWAEEQRKHDLAGNAAYKEAEVWLPKAPIHRERLECPIRRMGR